MKERKIYDDVGGKKERKKWKHEERVRERENERREVRKKFLFLLQIDKTNNFKVATSKFN